MSIQKKSLLSSLNATKKAIVASSAANEETPKVSVPVTGRVASGLKGRVASGLKGRVASGLKGRVGGMKAGRVTLRIASPIEGRKRK